MSELLLFFLIGFCIFLYYRTRTLQKQIDRLLSEEQLEQALDHFVEEIKKENDDLALQLVGKRETQARQEENETHKANEKSAQVLPFTYTAELLSSERTDPEMQENKQGTWLQLLDEGYSATEIAKRLHMGVTEVELMIAFKQKKNGSNQ